MTRLKMLDFLVCVFLFLFDNKTLSEYLLCIITQLLSYLALLFIANDLLDICWYQGLNRGGKYFLFFMNLLLAKTTYFIRSRPIISNKAVLNNVTKCFKCTEKEILYYLA